MTRVEDLCISCKHFDRGNWECKKGFYLDGDPSKGMYVDAFEHYHIHDRRRPGSRNVIAYSKYNREMNYEEEE